MATNYSNQDSEPESDTSNCASSKSSLSGSPPGSPARKKDPSFISESDTDITPTKLEAKIGDREMLSSLKDLRGKSVCQWNDDMASVVYRAFNVKRYKVDEEHILSPVSGPTVEEILDQCDDHKSKTASWIEFQLKMTGILELFRGESELLSTGVTNFNDFFKARQSLLSNMERQKRDQYGLQSCLETLLEEIDQALQTNKTLPESFYEAYFQQLLDLFSEISEVRVSCSKSTIFQSFEIAMPSVGTIPRPDFFLTKRFSILAVVEVKSGQKLHYATHKGHRPKSYKDRQNSTSQPKLDSATDEVPARKKLKLMAVDKDMDDDLEEWERKKANEELNDTFDAEEAQLEKIQNETLPNHVKHLDITEKKQIRGFMPQLLGQMLACTAIKEKSCFMGFQHPYMTHVMGIGVVGFQVQFVMLVLKDVTGKKIPRPTVADVKFQSVRPYLYVTRRLNLFSRKHLRIVFRILFALGSIGQVVLDRA